MKLAVDDSRTDCRTRMHVSLPEGGRAHIAAWWTEAAQIDGERHGAAETPRILLTGASGYVGGRLRSLLERDGYRVRCLARNPAMLRQRAGPATEVVAGDVLDRASLDSALVGIDAAYYLVHSMGSAGSFEAADRQAALNFGAAAQAAGVRRLVYLGGLGDEHEALSAHLRSRQEVGELLRRSGVPVLEFRAYTVDCWRVEALEPDRRLRLIAEMKLPGRAWLEFEVTGEGESSTIRQIAIFDPVGLQGRAYWYALYPLHHLVFGGMLRGIASAAMEGHPDR